MIPVPEILEQVATAVKTEDSIIRLCLSSAKTCVREYKIIYSNYSV